METEPWANEKVDYDGDHDGFFGPVVQETPEPVKPLQEQRRPERYNYACDEEEDDDISELTALIAEAEANTKTFAAEMTAANDKLEKSLLRRARD